MSRFNLQAIECLEIKFGFYDLLITRMIPLWKYLIIHVLINFDQSVVYQRTESDLNITLSILMSMIKVQNLYPWKSLTNFQNYLSKLFYWRKWVIKGSEI